MLPSTFDLKCFKQKPAACLYAEFVWRISFWNDAKHDTLSFGLTWDRNVILIHWMIFFRFSLGGCSFFSQHCSALFRAAVICTVSFDTDGYFKPLRWGEGEKGICCQSQRQCSSISHRLFAKSLHFKWAWNVKVGFLMLGLCSGMERENRGKMIMLVC